MSISQNFPNTRPSLNLNFARSQTLDPRITFTRTTTGTRVGPDGYIEVIPADQPRFDFDPVTGECLGLLIEEQRTNLIAYSKEHSQWITNGNVTVTSNDTIAPDGTLSADKIIGVSEVFDGKAYNVSGMIGNRTYTVVSFIKTDNQTQTRIGVFSSVDSWYSFLDTNWNPSGDPTTQTSSGASNITYEEYPNKWYRVSFQFTTPSTINGTISYFHMPDRTDTQKYAWFWGAQLEQGFFPTSYIPTSGSTVTRTPDNAKIDGENFTDFYNPSEGTVYTQFSCNNWNASNSFGKVFTINEGIFGVENNGFWIGNDANTSNSVRYRVRASGINQFGPANLIRTSNIVKSALSVKTSDFAVTIDGSTPTTSTSGTLSTSMTNMTIGRDIIGIDNVFLNGHISQLTYYPVRLPNNVLQTLTK